MNSTTVLSLTPNPTIDKSSEIDRVAPEIKLRCERSTYEPGGGGVNVARVLDRLDVNTDHIYPSGGPHGEFLQHLLNREGLEHTPIEISGITRESFMVVETSSGQQYRFSEPGPELTDDEWGTILERVQSVLESGVDYVVGSGSLPPGVPTHEYATIGGMARKHDVKFILDTSGEFLLNGLDGHPFLIKPNIRELEQIHGEPLESDTEIIHAARALVDDKNLDHVVVSMGAGGAMLINENGEWIYRAPTVSIESKVGAGDSMVGGIVYGLLHCESIRNAVKYGVAAGAAAVKTPGSELCHADDVQTLHNRVTSTKRRTDSAD